MNIDSLAQIPRIEDSFDPKNPDGSCLRLVRQISEDWKLDDAQIELKPFEEGITNTIMRATPLRDGHSESDAERDSVLIRGTKVRGLA